MYKIAIIANNLFIANGADRTASHAINALNKIDIIPDVYSFVEGSKEDIYNNYQLSTQFNYLPLWGKTIFPSYRPILKNIQFLFKSYDIVLDFAGFLGYQDKKGYAYFVHFPEFVLANYNAKYQTLAGKIYLFPRKLFFDIFQRNNYKNFNNLKFFCNSKFTASVIKETSGKDVEILYPPVSFPENKYLFSEKNFSVITLGRLGIEKKQDEQIEIASTLPEITFNICGACRENDSYVSQLEQKIDTLKLKNLSLHKNKQWNEIEALFSRSSIFLHSMRHEHFGISTVEAVFRGCLPVVHNSGGQKEIVPFPELRYHTPEDASQKIKILKENPLLMETLYNKVFEHCLQFKAENFEKRIIDFVKESISN